MPDYCFTTHQRTIFGVADSGKPATMSLSPSTMKKREVNESRLKGSILIACINDSLATYSGK
jgi:hypothetical protein